LVTILIIFLKINCPNFSRLVWPLPYLPYHFRRHFQVIIRAGFNVTLNSVALRNMLSFTIMSHYLAVQKKTINKMYSVTEPSPGTINN